MNAKHNSKVNTNVWEYLIHLVGLNSQNQRKRGMVDIKIGLITFLKPLSSSIFFLNKII